MKCDNCFRKIKYKTSMKLTKKNMYVLQCPNCKTLLKVTSGSLTLLIIMVALSILLVSDLNTGYWVKALFYVAWILL